MPETPRQFHGARFLQENALTVAQLAIAGFGLRYIAADLLQEADDRLIREYLRDMSMLLADIPIERAFLVIETLNELHPRREQLNAVVADMRKRMGRPT